MRPANNDPVTQCLIIYRIRRDTPEPQKQFGLWWAGHSISRLKSLIQRDSDPKWRNNTKHWCKCFDTLSTKLWKQYPPKSWTINIFMHFTTECHGIMRFPSPISSFEATAPVRPVASTARLRLQEPLDHGIVAVEGCQVQRRFASGAAVRRPSHGQNPNRNEGEKNIWEKFWAPQKSKFWKLWPLINPPWTSGTMWL